MIPGYSGPQPAGPSLNPDDPPGEFIGVDGAGNQVHGRRMPQSIYSSSLRAAYLCGQTTDQFGNPVPTDPVAFGLMLYNPDELR